MMARALKHAEEIARMACEQASAGVAGRVREVLRGAAVEIEGTNIVVTGRGLLNRWLSEPRLRFLGGMLK